MPNGSRRDHFLHWIENLSDRQSPSWLGLPNNAEKVLLTTRGNTWHILIYYYIYDYIDQYFE